MLILPFLEDSIIWFPHFCRNLKNTSTAFREKTDYLCQSFIHPHARILCCLGESDIRVQYEEFLLRLQEQGYQVSCWGPIASQSEACPIDPKFPRNGTEMERNMATAYFNQLLSEFCQEHDILFLSIFEKMITPEYLTLEQYLSPDRCHLGQAALSLALPEWQKLL